MLRDQNNVQVTAGEQGSEVKNKHTSTWRGGGGVITVNNMTEGGGRLHSRVGPSSTWVREELQQQTRPPPTVPGPERRDSSAESGSRGGGGRQQDRGPAPPIRKI